MVFSSLQCPLLGALMTKGTRFVLANTEELHAKILEMSERIRQLENAVSSSTQGQEPHPLLREDLLLIKVPIEFRNDSSPKLPSAESPPRDKDTFPTLLDAFGTLKIGVDGHSRFFGQTARTEVGFQKLSSLCAISQTRSLFPSTLSKYGPGFISRVKVE